MTVEMFPESECVPITDNVFLHRREHTGSPYKVWFRVGVQYFQIGGGHDDLEHARWHASMLVKALDRFKAGLDPKGED